MAFRPLRQHGFTLIEALVALLVLSIGLLGVAAMQLEALKSAHAAYQRSIASLAAQDAQERLWGQLALDGGACPTWANANDIGGVDVTSWDASWAEYLPDFNSDEAGTGGSVTAVVPNNECEFSITVSWSEGRFSDEGNPEFNYTVRLTGE
ncbi:type IV pilus modification protein PilV [Halomonas korlensis]|uniref:Type IV pilus assembly protein PilV n=1 Tax=Halomonas korlensis TaxID=463301 RepID=A0A1I7K1R1_9GAMM|nr:type IV pilus modification protein PilV [Halomonas korlensis]SFU91386.1 type IV pilus assembly protein PilV [Halomonas korlensis]